MINPLVSVLVSCYNHEIFLGDFFNSLISQTYNNIELIFIDDCSPDESWNVVQKYYTSLTERFESCVISRNEINKGLVKNLNNMIKVANGKYIKIIASDDFLKNDAIEKYVEYMETNDDCDICVSNGYAVSENSTLDNIDIINSVYDEAPNLSSEDLFKRIYTCNFIFAPGAFVKKSVYDLIGLYDEDICFEDWDMWLRASCLNDVKWGYLDAELIYYRKNSLSMSSIYRAIDDRRKRFISNQLKTLKKHMKCAGKTLYYNSAYNILIAEFFMTYLSDDDSIGYNNYIRSMIRFFPDFVFLNRKNKIDYLRVLKRDVLKK